MKRTGFIFLAVVVFVALGFSQLYAQGDMTLEGLAANVKTITARIGNLEVEDGKQEARFARLARRVSALETEMRRLRPPLSPTRRPTATPTRRPTPRPTATALPGLSVQEYGEYVANTVELLTAAMWGVNASFNNPRYNDSSWRELLDIYLATFKEEYDEARQSVPPASLRAAHNVFVRSTKHCSQAAYLIENGLDTRDGVNFEKAALEIKECTRLMTKATQMIGVFIE